MWCVGKSNYFLRKGRIIASRVIPVKISFSKEHDYLGHCSLEFRSSFVLNKSGLQFLYFGNRESFRRTTVSSRTLWLQSCPLIADQGLLPFQGEKDPVVQVGRQAEVPDLRVGPGSAWDLRRYGQTAPFPSEAGSWWAYVQGHPGSSSVWQDGLEFQARMRQFEYSLDHSSF